MTTFANPAIQQVADYLKQTLEPANQKKAELELHNLEKTQGFSISLLQLVASDAVNFEIRFAASVYFKNFVKKNWEEYEGEANPILDEERITIKAHVVNLMMSVPQKLQLQLSDAVSIIADIDFPHNWEYLIEDLIAKLVPNDYLINNGVLRTIHSILKRWRHQFRSDQLFLEIKQVLNKFCPVFEPLFLETDRQLSLAIESNDVKQADVLMHAVLLIAKLYYSCTFQDIPDFFLDHQTSFFPIFKKYLVLTHPIWDHLDDDEPSTLDWVKCAICEIISLFLDKYADDWTYTEEFVQVTSTVLSNITTKPKHDILVSRAMTLLSKIVQRPSLIAPFQNPDVLNSIVEYVVVPNMLLRYSDVESFEDDPIQFVLRNIEGAEVDTRAHAASDLVKNLMEYFEVPILTICEQHMSHALNAYYANSPQEYKHKDLAITLFIAVTSKSRACKNSTGLLTGTSVFNVANFLQSHIVLDLQTQAQVHPILVMDALKFLNVFRTFIEPSHRVELLKLVARHLNTSPFGIHLWGAMVCERYLCLLPKADAFAAAVSVAHLISPCLLKETVPNKLQENDALLKTIWRCMKLGYYDNEKIMQVCLHCLTVAAKNPSSPKFIHYLFECFALLIRETYTRKPEAILQLETYLFPLFFSLFQQTETTSDFIPFLLQLFAQLLEANQSTTLPPLYQPLLPMVFTPILWENTTNLAGLVLIVKSFLRKDSRYFVQHSYLTTLLGAAQLLLKSKVNFQYGFDLLKCSVVYIEPSAFQSLLKSLMNFLFVRLNTNPKSERFEQAFVSFFTFYVCTLPSVDTLIHVIESIQPGLTLSLLQHIVQKHFLTITGKEPRRILILGCTRLVSESTLLHAAPEFVQNFLVQLQKCIEQTRFDLDIPAFPGAGPIDGSEDDELQTQSTKLISVPVVQHVLLPQEPSPKTFFLHRMEKLFATCPNLAPILGPFLTDQNASR